MMFFSPPLFHLTNRYIQGQCSLFTNVCKQLVESTKIMNELNTQTAQDWIERSVEINQKMIDAKSPYDLFSVSMAQYVPIVETMRAYQQNVMSMVTGTQIELAKTAGSTVSQASDSAAAGAEEAVHQAAQGTEHPSQPRQSDIEEFSEPVQNSGGAQNGPIPEATRH
jgi:hypothetical protein